jgi:5'-3' exonuclease
MLALIDADILLYEIGSYTDDEGHPLSWPLCKSRADAKILKIMDSAGCDDYHLFLTGNNNFRIKEGTIKPYKGHRVSPKPPNHANLKKYFSESTNFKGKVTTSDDYEADDALSIKQYKELYWDVTTDDVEETYSVRLHGGNTVLCSRDKDLNMVPGLHYSWGSGKQKEKEVWLITEEEGNHWFFTQLLTGDSTDNIPGLYRVGAVAAKKLLSGLTEPLSLYSVVQHEYEVRFGSYWKLFMHENARLLWMLQTEDDDVRRWLDIMEDTRQLKLITEEQF